jgi:hypothetical protein
MKRNDSTSKKQQSNSNRKAKYPAKGTTPSDEFLKAHDARMEALGGKDLTHEMLGQTSISFFPKPTRHKHRP